MNGKYFFRGFFAVFGLYSISKLMQNEKRQANNSIGSYWREVGQLFKNVFDGQVKELQRK
jgi:hypothetical protein